MGLLLAVAFVVWVLRRRAQGRHRQETGLAQASCSYCSDSGADVIPDAFAEEGEPSALICRTCWSRKGRRYMIGQFDDAQAVYREYLGEPSGEGAEDGGDSADQDDR